MKNRLLFLGLILSTLTLSNLVYADDPRTNEEHALIEKLRARYKEQGLELTPERETEILTKFRKAKADALDAQAIS
ncbi:MAG: hypothetical protein LBI31_04755, partial [Zoogloeaceae bacterium]|nr:hypothetical protein [Zoogloeaceae bacterium]